MLYNCLHCGRGVNTVKRGLCRTCYGTAAIRFEYRPRADHEPTEEELEQIIREQMKTAWWLNGEHDTEE